MDNIRDTSTNSSHACPAPAVLQQVLAQTLPQSQARPLREHLLQCASCRALLDHWSDDPALKAVAAAGSPVSGPPPSLWQRLHPEARDGHVPVSTIASSDPVSLAFLAPPQQAGDLGTLGPYRVLEVLGQGGMGIVLKAYDPDLRHVVAVKVLRPDRADEPARVRFRREAQAAASLAHDHVVAVHAVSPPTENPTYLVMQYIAGPTLLERIQSERRLPPEEAAGIARQVAEGLAAAHRAGLVHRDIKPSNILLDPSTGRAKITDFGLVHMRDGQGAATTAGLLLGTPEYMSPEQARGERADESSDLYGLGVTLYEALTGTVPFPGTPYQVLRQIQDKDPLAPRRLNPAIPRDLETICLACLQKEPHKRYASAQALAEDLRRFLSREPIRARPTPAWERAVKWARRRPAIAALLSVLLLVVALGFGGVTWQWRQAEQARRDAVEAREEVETTLYFSRIAEAEQHWRMHNVARMETLLQLCLPAAGRPDRRGWEWHHLQRLCHAELCTLQGHQQWVYSVAFSPDGQRLASAAGDPFNLRGPGELKLWDTTTGQQIRTLSGLTRNVFSVAFSPDGRRLASAGGEIRRPTDPGELKVWDATTGAELLTLHGHAGPIWNVAFSPDGRLLASASMDRTVRVWDATTGEELLSRKGHSGQNHVAFSPDGLRLASVGPDQAIQLWDAATGQEVQSLRGHTDVCHLAFSPDRQRLASASTDGSIRIWDRTTAQPLHTLRVPSGHVWSVAFSPDGQQLASASADSSVRLWDVASGVELHAYRGHAWGARAVAFSPDGRRLASASQDQTVKIWDATRNPQALTLRKPDGMLNEVAFSADGSHAISARGVMDSHGWLKVWDARTGTLVDERHADIAPGNEWPYTYIAFRADGRSVASASRRDLRVVNVLDATTGEVQLALHGHTLPVKSVAFSRDGRRLASAGASEGRQGGPSEVKVWDLAEGRALVTFRGHQQPITCLAWSPDGQRFASASHDATVKVWDSATGREQLSLAGHRDAVASVAFSPDGRQLASVGYIDETVRFWDAQTGRLLRTWPGPSQMTQILFSPDGHRVAVASADLVTIWATRPGHEAFTLRGLTGQRPEDRAFNARVAFSSDGRRLVTTNSDHSLHVWDSSDENAAARPVPFPARGQTGQAWHQTEAEDSEQNRHWFAAVFHLSKLLATEPANGELYARRGRARAELEQWEHAGADLANAVALRPDDPKLWYEHACLRWQLGDTEGYRHACRQMLARFGQTQDPDVSSHVVRAATLAPQSAVAPERLVHLAEQAVARRPRSYWCLHMLGAAHYRANQFPQAIQRLQEARGVPPHSGIFYLDYLLLALALRRGQLAEVNSQLEDALQEVDRLTALGYFINGTHACFSWNERLELRQLRREAEALRVNGEAPGRD